MGKRIEDMTDAELQSVMDKVIANNLAKLIHPEPKPKFVKSERVEDDEIPLT